MREETLSRGEFSIVSEDLWRKFVMALMAMVLSLAVVACGQPAATPQPTPGPADPTPEPETTPEPLAAWEQEWERTLEAARQEGTVTVVFTEGGEMGAIRRFNQAYPDIQAEFLAVQAREFNTRIVREREAGIYEYDVSFAGVTSALTGLIQGGVYADLREAFILPEITDDATWIGNYEDWWVDDVPVIEGDEPRKYMFNFGGEASSATVYVNRDVLSEAEFRSVDDLFKPELQGRWCSYDPRVPGAGATLFTEMMVTKGPDFVQQLFMESPPVIGRDRTQMAQDLIRGTYDVCVGPLMPQFWAEGVGLHIEEVALETDELAPEYREQLKIVCCGAATGGLTLDGFLSVGAGRYTVSLYDRAPNPNAARVFINWVLTDRDAQEGWWDPNESVCSFRVDMQAWCAENVPLYAAPEDGKGYITFHRASNVDYRADAQRLAEEILGR